MDDAVGIRGMPPVANVGHHGLRVTASLRRPTVAWITAGLRIQTPRPPHLYCEFAVYAVRNASPTPEMVSFGATLLADLLRPAAVVRVRQDGS